MCFGENFTQLHCVFIECYGFSPGWVEKRLWVLATISFPHTRGGLRGDAPHNGLKTTRGQWCNKDLLLKPGASTGDQRNSGTLKVQVRTRRDGISCEGENRYSGRNVWNQEIWGERKRTRGKKSKRCLKRNLGGMIHIQVRLELSVKQILAA